MYILTISALLALLILAAVLSLFGVFSFSLVALVVTTLVFVGVSIASSYLLGKLYGIHSHLQSALITALILVLLFTPSLSVVTLLQYALVALIAQASKFVIVSRGRHIMNPAAFGAVMIGSVLQFQYPSWWVGAPAMLVVTAILSYAVLYKTRYLALGGVFLLVSAGILMLKGIDLWTILSSWPLVFLAGFMLSEPATLPPRHWQQLVVAAVVGIVVALPFEIGTFSSSPAVALLIGNVLAFLLAYRKRTGFKMQLVGRHLLTPTTEELVFQASRTPVFSPGQYLELTLPHKGQDIRGIRRSFSIASTPGKKEIKLGVKYYQPSSTFKRALRALPVGSVVQTTGIAGDFTLPPDSKQKLLLIAGGIGVTPFISHIESLSTQARDVVLLYFVREPSEIAYKTLLDKSTAKVIYCVSERPQHGMVQARGIDEAFLRKYVPDHAERTTYISGPPAMVSAAKSTLRGRVKRIKTDYFSGY